MTDIENTNVENVTNDDTSNKMYIDKINELKKNSVSIEEYNKLKEDNRNLLDSLTNGQVGSTDEKPVQRPLEDIREELFNKETTNLKFVENALELRDRLLEEGKPDVFLPSGHDVIATEEDIATANRVADSLRKCVEYANGDPQIFTNELQRIMVDSSPMRRK